MYSQLLQNNQDNNTIEGSNLAQKVSGPIIHPENTLTYSEFIIQNI